MMTFRKQIHMNTIWLLLFALALAACSSGPPKGSSQSFKTRITESGLKHFELRYNRPERSVRVNPYARTRQQSDRPETEREGERLVSQMKGHLAKIMEHSDYCREGYWILKADPFERSPYIRGECHDLANPEDRARFPDTLLAW